jgi:hypothetical protein
MYALCALSTPAEHDQSLGLIPAWKRYYTLEVERLYQLSLAENLPLFILSGLFGLIPAHTAVPPDDHMLNWHEVAALIPRVCSQFSHHRIEALLFFGRRSLPWQPYRFVMRSASAQGKVLIEERFFD